MRQTGFTTFEMTVAVALLGTAVITLVSTLTVAFRGSGVVSARNTALQLARSQIESVKDQPYAEPIAYSTNTPPSQEYAISVSGTVLQAGYLERIDVSVSYPERNNRTATTTLSAYKVNHLPPILADKPLPPPAPECPAGATCFAYFLHNNPSPPTGNTSSQPDLPMDATSRFAYDTFNYDQNRDDDAGLLIRRGGSGASEADPAKFQSWRTTSPFAGDFHVQGQVEVHIWSAIRNFNQHKNGEVRVFLRRWTGSAYVEIANASVAEPGWQGGFDNFVLAQVLIPGVDHTVPAGQFLEVKVLVGSGANDDMWFMYDNVDFESRVYVPTVSP